MSKYETTKDEPMSGREFEFLGSRDSGRVGMALAAVSFPRAFPRPYCISSTVYRLRLSESESILAH